MFGTKRLDQLDVRYELIARNLHDWQLKGGWQQESLEDAVIADLIEHRGPPRFLGYYSPEGVRVALGAYGIWDHLGSLGYQNWNLQLDVQDPYHQTLTVRSARGDKLIEIRAGILEYLQEIDHPLFRQRRFLHVEWLLMQHPEGKIADSVLLPGQDFPGLGASATVIAMLIQVCRRLHLDGIVVHPAWYHNAVLYHSRFRFVDPVAEGRFRALNRLRQQFSLVEVSWAFEAGLIRDELNGNKQVLWQGTEQVVGTGDYIKEWFGARSYTATRSTAQRQSRFNLNRQELQAWMSARS